MWKTLLEEEKEAGRITEGKIHLDATGLEGYGSNLIKWKWFRNASWLAWMSWAEGHVSVMHD